MATSFEGRPDLAEVARKLRDDVLYGADMVSRAKSLDLLIELHGLQAERQGMERAFAVGQDAIKKVFGKSEAES